MNCGVHKESGDGLLIYVASLIEVYFCLRFGRWAVFTAAHQPMSSQRQAVEGAGWSSPCLLRLSAVPSEPAQRQRSALQPAPGK